MPRGIYFFIVTFLIIGNLFGQETQWAHDVIEFSSEKKLANHYEHLHPNAYKASQVLDEPNIMPGSEGTAHAWTPRKPNEIDFIKVGFKDPIHVKQMVVAEAINPSALTEVFIYDSVGVEYLVNNFTPTVVPLHGRLLHIFMERTKFKVHAVKIVLDGSKVPGFNGIDAIGISESDIPIEVTPKMARTFMNAHQATRLEGDINSDYKEIKPLLAPDGKRMYFSRINHPHNTGGRDDVEDIWYSDLDTVTGEWGKPVNPGKPLNNKGPNFICSIAPRNYYYDLLLGNTYKGKKMIGGLSIASRYDSGYTEPERVIIEDDYNLSEHANYFLTDNEEAIIMSVQRTDGYGDRDLYVTFPQYNGKWSKPLNLGDVINTAEAEASPYLAMDHKTLYFSSEGHLGYGGEDIFVSRRLDSTWTNWSEPENLGPSVNSLKDDLFFNLAPDYQYAYFTRGDMDNTDIYRMELPVFLLPEPLITFRGTVRDGRTMEPVPNALIQFRDIRQHRIISQLRGDKNSGKFQVVLPTGTVYRIFVYYDSLVSKEDEQLVTDYVYESDTVLRDILLYPTKDGKPVNLMGTLRGVVVNGSTNEPIGNAKIVFKDIKNNVKLADITTEKGTGRYEATLPIGYLYNLSADAKGYISVENEVIDLSESFEGDTIKLDFQLFPTEVGTRIALDNIFFDFDKATLKRNSVVQLYQVFQFLDTNPRIKIELDGHTCSLGDADYNQKLSEDRALAVREYLVGRGIAEDRITSVGFGETKPLDDNTNSQGREKNRRVEFVILEN